jgi:hypothetical protein
VEVAKDREARLAQEPDPQKFIRRTPAMIAVGYWLFTMLVFFGLQNAGMDMIGTGGIPMAVLTLPWSLLVIAMTSSASSAPALSLLHSPTSPVRTFVLFPVICGGLNALAIYGLLIATGRRKQP